MQILSDVKSSFEYHLAKSIFEDNHQLSDDFLHKTSAEGGASYADFKKAWRNELYKVFNDCAEMHNNPYIREALQSFNAIENEAILIAASEFYGCAGQLYLEFTKMLD